MPAGTVQQTTNDLLLRQYGKRLANLENNDGSSPWITVGSGVQIGVDAANDPIYAPDFENGWDNIPGAPPLQFKRFLNWVHFRGGFLGGVDGSVVFTLPIYHRPLFEQPMLIPMSSGTGTASVLIQTDGTVTFIGYGSGGGGGGTVTQVTSVDSSVTISDPFGPVVDLSVAVTGIAFNTEPQTGGWLNVETTGTDGDGYGIMFQTESGILFRLDDGVDTSQAILDVLRAPVTGKAHGLNVAATAVDDDATAAIFVSQTADDDNSVAVDATGNASGTGGATGGSFGANSVDGGAIAVSAFGSSNGAGVAIGLAAGATINDALQTQAAYGADLQAHSGAGDAIGLRIANLTSSSGTIYEILVLDSLGGPILRLDDDGTLHIKTGAAILADL